MKKILLIGFRSLIGLILVAKILDWFLNFSDKTTDLLNMAMFSLIGIAYLFMGYMWDTRLKQIVVITCGVFLIMMNFFSNNLLINIVAIFCILTPMFIARFYKEKPVT
jgi:hypothetical protein